MSKATVEMVRAGIRPAAAERVENEELEALRATVLALRGDLAAARAQRDATQKALDKANRDNDTLRAELRVERVRSAEMAGLYEMAERSLKRVIGEREAKTLVDGEVVYELEEEE